ncbi:MAG: glycosyltransferase family 9 protein [Gemmatimonadales bacterium]
MGWKGALVEGPLAVASRLIAPWPAVPAAPREILVLRANDLGDLHTTTPAFAALRMRFPTSRIVAAVGSWAREVLQNNPNVDEIVELDAPWNNKFAADQSWRAVARFLSRSEQVAALRRRGGFDAGIDVLGSHVGALLMMRLGVRFRIGVRGYRGGWSACQRYIRFSDRVHVARAALDQAALLGATQLPPAIPQLFPSVAEQAEAGRLWGARGAGVARLIVGCGGGLEGKCWPADQMAGALARLAQVPRAGAAGRFEMLIVGGKADRDRGRRIVELSGGVARSLCGETSLRTTFALTAAADAVLTNASMLAHTAAAFGKPTVVVIGGMHQSREAYDRLWGYPPPYRSIGPVSGEERAREWPDVASVAAAVARLKG